MIDEAKEISKLRFKVLNSLVTKKDNYKEALCEYENYINENKIEDRVFLNLLKYDAITQDKIPDKTYLSLAKEQALGDIDISNFVDKDISILKLSILLEEVYFNLSNSMHLVSKPEEYAYYTELCHNVEEYAARHYTDEMKAYIFIRLYKIMKLVWNKRQLCEKYENIEKLYDLLNKIHFDYYQFKLNADLIDMADYAIRFEIRKEKDWKATYAKYKADEQALIYLLGTHPRFATKSFILWLYTMDLEFNKYLTNEVFAECNFTDEAMFDNLREKMEAADDKTDVYKMVNTSVIEILQNNLQEIIEGADKTEEALEFVLKMKDYILYHYDLTYFLAYMDLKNNFEYAIAKKEKPERADKIREDNRKRFEMISRFINK